MDLTFFIKKEHSSVDLSLFFLLIYSFNKIYTLRIIILMIRPKETDIFTKNLIKVYLVI